MKLPVVNPVPLVVPMAPNPARDAPINALRSARRAYDLNFESVGIADVEAALEAGVGVCAAPRTMRLHGVSRLGRDSGLAPLPKVEFAMTGPDEASKLSAKAFANTFRAAARFNFSSNNGPAKS